VLLNNATVFLFYQDDKFVLVARFNHDESGVTFSPRNVKQSDKSFHVCNLARSVTFFSGGWLTGRSSRFVHDLPAKKSAIQKSHFHYIRMGGLINDSDRSSPSSLSLSPSFFRTPVAACFDRAEIKRRCWSLIPGQYGLPSVNGVSSQWKLVDPAIAFTRCWTRESFIHARLKRTDNQTGRR